MKIFLLSILFVSIAIVRSHADDFYNIQDIQCHLTSPGNGVGIFKQVQQIDANNRKVKTNVFVPCLGVRVVAQDSVKANSIIAHVYFYDQTKALLATVSVPNDLPVILPKDKEQTIFFAIPVKVLQEQEWSAVVIFGDSKGVDGRLYPGTDELSDYDYPEKTILEDKNGPPIERQTAMDPMVVHVEQTENPNQPQLTLFMRPPLGMTDASQAKGVLCMSLLAGSVEGVKRQLQGMEAQDQLSGVLKFAEEHKLIVIGWGSHGLWDPTKNWDEQSEDKTWLTDKAFDQVTQAWTNGIQYFIKEYGIPRNNYLLWGESGSAQYACRLALRRPDYFLAIHAHIPSSFDKPTQDANRVLWCLTTGELESGHRRSLRFYAQSRAMGYPMVYKAVIGLGHAWSPISANLGLRFFEYALSVRDQRQAYDASLQNPLAQFQLSQNATGEMLPWIESFRKPAYVGDIVNQGMVTFDQVDSVPSGFRVSLPTKEIAEAWNH